MVCPFCSEEHPVTLDRCPLTGQQLRAPVPVEALPAREERATFSSLLAEAARLYRRNLLVFLVTGSVAFVPFAGLLIWSGLEAVPPPEMREAVRITMRASQEHRSLSTEEQAQLQRASAATRPDNKDFLIGMALMLMFFPLLLATQMLSHAALVPLVGDRALGGKMGVLMGPLSLLFFRAANDPTAMFDLMSGWRGIGLQLSQIVISMLLFPLPVIGTTLVYLHARREQENIPLAELQLQMQRAATGT
jgi:hypothetical protein